MRLGLRPQILLSLGLLLALAFVPLYFAISAYTSVAIQREHYQGTAAVALAVAKWAAHVPKDPGLEPGAESTEPVRALVVVDAQGGVVRRSGSDAEVERLLALLSRRANTSIAPRLPLDPNEPTLIELAAAGEHRAAVLAHVGPAGAGPLNRLLALYMALVGLALLVGVYFTVTAWIIRPLGQISQAATRVASASHRLELPATRSRELDTLAASLTSMTRKLADDETALRRQLVELDQAQKQLEAAQSHLVRSERLASVGQLAAGLAHEIGNPIAAMRGLQDLILEGGLDQEQQLDFTQRMRRETERISRIIRDLLDFARAGQAGAGGEPANVEAAIHETVTLVNPQPLLRNVHLSLDVYPELPLVSLGHGQLTQVLLNLVLNAAAACKDGGGVRVIARPTRDGVELAVEDTGPGVRADLVDRIFEPFVSSKEVGEGSGLGLSVCRGLVEAAGGSIQLEVDHRPGVRFVVQLKTKSDVDATRS